MRARGLSESDSEVVFSFTTCSARSGLSSQASPVMQISPIARILPEVRILPGARKLAIIPADPILRTERSTLPCCSVRLDANRMPPTAEFDRRPPEVWNPSRPLGQGKRDGKPESRPAISPLGVGDSFGMIASGMVTFASAAEPAKNTEKKSTKQTTAAWRSTSKVDSKLKKVSASQVDEAAAEKAAGEANRVATEAAEEAKSAVEQTPAALPDKTPAVEASELPVKPVDADTTSTMNESATTEVIEEVVPVSVSTGLCPPGRLWVRKEVLLW